MWCNRGNFQAGFSNRKTLKRLFVKNQFLCTNCAQTVPVKVKLFQIKTNETKSTNNYCYLFKYLEIQGFPISGIEV